MISVPLVKRSFITYFLVEFKFWYRRQKPVNSLIYATHSCKLRPRLKLSNTIGNKPLFRITSKRANWPKLVENVQAADNTRDERIIGFYEDCSACARRCSPEVASGGKTLLAFFEIFGGSTNLSRVNFDEQSTRIDNFLSNLRSKPHLRAAVEATDAAQWLTEIGADQGAFRAARQERLRHATDNKPAFKIIEKRKIVRSLYKDIMDMINGAAKLALGGEPWITLARRLNRINEEFTEREDIREGRAESAKAAAATPTP
ncbi:DUF6261 family protein [Flaviaesturariibacter amylovorans]|uniref:Uncharacterized protein n=1 Tax=Flaviaesturariibacter amylovorans TaxID=1084520 RepID=A0ABP8G612_9BACT